VNELMNKQWFEPSLVLMHLSLFLTCLFSPLKVGTESWEPSPFQEVPESFQHQIYNILGVKKEGWGWGRNPVGYV
jgi:hypothetical protein